MILLIIFSMNPQSPVFRSIFLPKPCPATGITFEYYNIDISICKGIHEKHAVEPFFWMRRAAPAEKRSGRGLKVHFRSFSFVIPLRLGHIFFYEFVDLAFVYQLLEDVVDRIKQILAVFLDGDRVAFLGEGIRQRYKRAVAVGGNRPRRGACR
jgi:hypothetical protein